MRVSDVGEAGLLARIAERVPTLGEGETGPGDDAAVLQPLTPNQLVTSDILVEGIDFDLSYTSGFDLGWKLLAVNVSDICAMGGRARDAVISIVLRGELDLDFFDAFLEGSLAAGHRFGTRLVGGDISGGDTVTACATLMGSGEKPVLRSGARPGDQICVTGHLGGSAAGLRLLRSGAGERSPAAVQRHLRPEPRTEEGPLLAAAGATAMIDVSDGLALDLKRLMEASGTGCRVDARSIPVDPAAAAVFDDAEALASTGGEDFELLVTIPSGELESATQQLGAGVGLTRIGEVVEEGMMIGQTSLDEGGELGWEHLRNR